MDWYYPVLAGPVRGAAARGRLDARWDEFVEPGVGVRCVSDQPWVTGAETCELVLALDAVGDRARAIELYAAIQHLRHDDGGYWTGWQFANQAYFPAERSSWTAAAMILAADALSGATGGDGPVQGRGCPAAPGGAAGPVRLRLPGPACGRRLADPRAAALQHPQRAQHADPGAGAGGQRPAAG